MARKQRTELQVEEILDSLSGMERAEPRPFFYTRLQARLAAETDPSAWGRAMAFLSRPAVSMATLILFLLVNGVILFSAVRKNQATEVDSSQAIASEYVEVGNQYAYVNQYNP
jgi:hypothetical protein